MRLLFWIYLKFATLALRFRLLFERKKQRARGWQCVPSVCDIILHSMQHEAILYAQRFLDSNTRYVLIDVGANTGYWAARFRRYVPAKYVGFEPDPRAFKPLRERFPSDVLHNVCVGSEAGVIELNLDSDSTFTSKYNYEESLRATENRRRAQVDQVTLDSMIESDGPYILKVDVQGAEGDVLDGAVETLKKTAVLIIEVPLFRQTKEGRNSLSDITCKLHALNFEPAYFCQAGLGFDKQTIPIEHDVIFVNTQSCRPLDFIR